MTEKHLRKKIQQLLLMVRILKKWKFIQLIFQNTYQHVENKLLF